MPDGNPAPSQQSALATIDGHGPVHVPDATFTCSATYSPVTASLLALRTSDGSAMCIYISGAIDRGHGFVQSRTSRLHPHARRSPPRRWSAWCTGDAYVHIDIPCPELEA